MSTTMSNCLHAALRRTDPALGVESALSSLKPRIGQTPVVVVGCGKAASTMLCAAVSALGANIVGGVIVTKYDHIRDAARAASAATGVLGSLQLMEAGHPHMDEAGQRAALALVNYVRMHARGTVVLALLSGGGSALTPLPVPGISFSDFQSLNATLLQCGASIDEINACRKHVSAFSGGRLALEAEQAGATALITLAVSDVIGDRPDVIASGPTVPDLSTYRDALGVIARYGIDGRVPHAVMAHLRAGCAGDIPETPKLPPGIPHHFQVVAGNRTALSAAAAAAAGAGYLPVVLTACMHGEARHAAAMFASMVQEVVMSRALPTDDAASSLGSLGPAPTPSSASPNSTEAQVQQASKGRRIALLAGGETTVTLGAETTGKGGRNQEFALAAAVALGKVLSPAALQDARFTLAALGTDGTDGPTDAAGAVVTQHTLAVAKAAGLDPEEYLGRHDAYSFFAALEAAEQAPPMASPTGVAGIQADTGDGAAHASAPQETSGREALESETATEADKAAAAAGLQGMPGGLAGGLIRTGPTGTNVMDIVLVLID